jgi:PHD/YefM family antitoxin component YafN of YafNO toxin-antitoxin module
MPQPYPPGSIAEVLTTAKDNTQDEPPAGMDNPDGSYYYDVMSETVISASDVRIPNVGRDAIARHNPVVVQSHGRAVLYMIHPAEYEAVSALLERRRRGQPVAVDELLDDEDFLLLREERAADRDLAEGIVEGWL